MRPKPPIPNEFAYCLARSTQFREFAIQNMVGTSGRQRVQTKALGHFLVASPTKQVALAFRDLVRPLMAQATVVARESRFLAGLRDGLLPELISGRLRVNDVSELTEIGK